MLLARGASDPVLARDLALLDRHLDLVDPDLTQALKNFFDPQHPNFNHMEPRGLGLVGFDAKDYPTRGSDDRAVAVHFWFDTGDRSSTLFGRVAQLFGYPKVSHAITYVWGGVRGAGSVLRNPYFPNGAIIILRDRSALPGRWYDERRDLAADLRQAFGDTVGVQHLRYVALSGDTDDTSTRSLARVSDLLLIADEDTR